MKNKLIRRFVAKLFSGIACVAEVISIIGFVVFWIANDISEKIAGSNAEKLAP